MDGVFRTHERDMNNMQHFAPEMPREEIPLDTVDARIMLRWSLKK
jgi:hypothetical protein